METALHPAAARQPDAAVPALGPSRPSSVHSVSVTATYRLSEAGRKASLLTGGSGRQRQQVVLDVPVARMHLVHVDPNGTARLKLRPRFELRPISGSSGWTRRPFTMRHRRPRPCCRRRPGTMSSRRPTTRKVWLIGRAAWTPTGAGVTRSPRRSSAMPLAEPSRTPRRRPNAAPSIRSAGGSTSTPSETAAPPATCRWRRTGASRPTSASARARPGRHRRSPRLACGEAALGRRLDRCPWGRRPARATCRGRPPPGRGHRRHDHAGVRRSGAPPPIRAGWGRTAPGAPAHLRRTLRCRCLCRDTVRILTRTARGNVCAVGGHAADTAGGAQRARLPARARAGLDRAADGPEASHGDGRRLREVRTDYAATRVPCPRAMCSGARDRWRSRVMTTWPTPRPTILS